MTFDVDDFRAVYPQFAEMSDDQLTFIAQNALLLSGLENDTTYPEADKMRLWYMLVCHMATLSMRGTAGAMTGATEGSVSVSFSAPEMGKENAWYMLTPCGALYWEIIKGHKFGGCWFNGCHC